VIVGYAGSNHAESTDACPLVVLCCVVCVCVCARAYVCIYIFLNLPTRNVIYKRKGRMRWMQLNVMEKGSEIVN
jgi:hypothetical protein